MNILPIDVAFELLGLQVRAYRTETQTNNGLTKIKHFFSYIKFHGRRFPDSYICQEPRVLTCELLPLGKSSRHMPKTLITSNTPQNRKIKGAYSDRAATVKRNPVFAGDPVRLSLYRNHRERRNRWQICFSKWSPHRDCGLKATACQASVPKRLHSGMPRYLAEKYSYLKISEI